MSEQSDDEEYGSQGSEESEDSADQVPMETQLVQRTFDSQHRSVVRILVRGDGNKNSMCSGCVAHNNGAACSVLTTYHIFKRFSQDNMQVSVLFHGMDKEVPAKVLIAEPDKDLAVLLVPEAVPLFPPVEFSDEVDLSGRYVVMMGFFGLDCHSMVVEPGASIGRIMSEPFIYKGVPSFECFYANHTIEVGTSGGPVFLDEKVVGVNMEADIGKVSAISMNTVKWVLKSRIAGDNVQDLTIPAMLQQIASQS
ncbi:hypothetical protein CFC21_071410 [Triticum aestivum]|uniref:Uncharacterized protein n=3 Tax=Triticum aestivum TaxID=4565 RepID=A0A9R1HH00_WHEAT|nr:uncharacterized protein LOC123116098 isoform X1 [Triticum aestivum]XP_044393033.1 uncharacterized protein LOC123116098 isoform X1 [Triticum aestivum]KAF7065293.1 hypothetical protein CFC21_071410 [Triticum aestivum]